MILEEITGDVRVVLNGNTLSVGSIIEDSQYPLVSVIGKGTASFRVDPNCTVDVKGVDIPKEVPAPVAAPVPVPKVEAAPVAERVTPAMETPGKATEA
jgi:hypothetical protein